MTLNRCRQIGVSFVLLLSLAAASMAACICDHHEPVSTSESETCHGHSGDHAKALPGVDKSNVDAISGPECLCPAAVAKLATKTDNQQFKRAAARPVLAEITRKERIVPERRSTPVYFTETPQISDPFANIASSRGPPRS